MVCSVDRGIVVVTAGDCYRGAGVGGVSASGATQSDGGGC